MKQETIYFSHYFFYIFLSFKIEIYLRVASLIINLVIDNIGRGKGNILYLYVEKTCYNFDKDIIKER